jgi:hypothetical protein
MPSEVEIRLITNNSQAVKGIKEVAVESQKLYTNNEKGQKRQLGLIADIEKELEKLQKGQKKAMSLEGLAKYNQKMADAKRELEEYNKVGVETEEQTKKTTSGIGAMITKLLLAVATWKSFKAIMESTETTAISFHSTINALKSGLDYFMKSIATAGNGGFDGFVRGLKEAIKAGSDYTKELARISNVRRQYQIREADLNKEIEEQRRILYEDDKLAMSEKIKAGDVMLSKMKEKSELETKIARESYLAATELAGKKNKLTEEELNYAIRNFDYVEETGNAYNRMTDLIEQFTKRQKQGFDIGGDSNKQYVEFLGQTMIMTQEQVTEYEQAIERLGAKAPFLGKLIKSFGSVTEAERQTLTDGILNIKQAENQYNVESKRVYRMVNNMKDQNDKTMTDKQKKQNKIDFDVQEEHYIELRDMFFDYIDDINKKKEDQWKFDLENGEINFNALRNQAKRAWDKMLEDEKALADAEKEVSNARMENLTNAGQSVLDFISIIDTLAQTELDNAEKKRELLDTQIDEAQSAVETETELYAAGYASNVAAKQTELDALKKQREQALLEEEEATKKAHTLKVASLVAEQAIALAKVIMSSEIAKAEARILIANPITAIPGAALLAAIKIGEAISIAAITASVVAASLSFDKGGWTGEGNQKDETGERVAGKVHAREFVVRKGPANKFREVLEAINKDDRNAVFNSFNKLSPEILGGTAVNNILVENTGPNKRLDEVNHNLKRMSAKEDTQIIGNVMIIRKGNRTRRVRL